MLNTAKNDSHKIASVLVLANRLTSTNTAKLRDIIDYDTYRIDRNKIVDSLIKLVDN